MTKWLYSQSWPGTKPETRSFMQVFHVSVRTRALRPSSSALSGHQQGAGSEMELVQVPIWYVGAMPQC